MIPRHRIDQTDRTAPVLNIERQRVVGIADCLGEHPDELALRERYMRVVAVGVIFERDVADQEDVLLPRGAILLGTSYDDGTP